MRFSDYPIFFAGKYGNCFFSVCSELERKHILKEFLGVSSSFEYKYSFPFFHLFEYVFFSSFEHDSISLFDTIFRSKLLQEKMYEKSHNVRKKIVILKKHRITKKMLRNSINNLKLRLSSCFLWIYEESGFKIKCV